MIRKIELLAPAKDFETAVDAVDCGADAVYIGAGRFGARYAATNTIDDIARVAEYAHRYGARLHCTLNTVLFDDELQDAERMAQGILAIMLILSLCACGGGEEAPQEDTSGLRAGYSKVNITPDYEVGLGGYSDAETRTATGLIEYIYLTCIAVSSGEALPAASRCTSPRCCASWKRMARSLRMDSSMISRAFAMPRAFL